MCPLGAGGEVEALTRFPRPISRAFRFPLPGVFFALAIAALSPVSAQESVPSGGRPGAPPVPREMLAYRRPASATIRVDGRLDEDVWQDAPSFADWVQLTPVEGAPAINDTRVWLLYDDEALYVGAINYDENPSSIATNMARRDAGYAGRSDYFEIMIDPNGDGLTGYRFRVTAGGVQTDRYLFNDGGEDSAWDAVYESPVTIDERGWIVEMRIPLSQFRYETADTAQTWGVQFGRRRASDNELTRFSQVSDLRPGRVSQFGRVGGLVLSRSSRRLEVLPYVVSRARHGPSADADPFFDGSAFDGRVGMDMSYGLGTAFTLDATLNPDFGQVEADPAVVNLSAFETFFREQRPFFVEDARVFDFNMAGRERALFYSRRVGRAPHGGSPDGADFVDKPDATTILGAAKLTGRTEQGFSVGALWAVTQAEKGEAYFSEEDKFLKYNVEPRSTFGVVRLQKDFSDGRSRVGGIATVTRRDLPEDQSFDGLTSSAYSVGLDFEHTWGDREWALWGFFAGSHVLGDPTAITRIQRASNHYLQRPDLEWSALDSTATSLTGADWRLQLERRVGHWTGALWAAEITNGFEINDLGFNTLSERLDGGFRIGWQEVRPTRYFRTSKVELSTDNQFSHEVLRDTWSTDRWEDGQTGGRSALNTNLEFLNFWTANLAVSYGADVMSRAATRGGPRMIDPGSWGLSLGFGTDNRKVLFVRPRLSLFRGRQDAGDRLDLGMSMTLQPSPRLLMTLTPSYQRSSNGAQYVAATATPPFEATYGTRYLFGELERQDLSMVARVNFTFTPRLSLEFFAQPLVSSVDYQSYKQLSEPETFSFDVFSEGTAVGSGDEVTCAGGRTCEDSNDTRYFDFDGNGQSDYSLTDRDFNLRSLRATAVLRWEYRPGSTLFLVWQRRQAERASAGDFDFQRDAGALFGAPADDVLILKANVWLSW